MPTRRSIWPLAAVLVAAAVLSGCKSQGPERAMARFHGTDAGRATAPPATPKASSETATADARVTAPEPQLAARPDPAAPPPEVDANPERFLGASGEALGAELGRPALVRAEGPARVWQYRGQACVLDLVLYPGTGGPTVRHLEARDPVDAQPRDTAACLKDLLQRRALAATG